MSLEDIAEALYDVTKNTLETNLSRMVKRGQLVRPDRGLYGLAVQ